MDTFPPTQITKESAITYFLSDISYSSTILNLRIVVLHILYDAIMDVRFLQVIKHAIHMLIYAKHDIYICYG